VLSTVGECADPNRPSRYARNFCMARCKGRDDCRPGYVCADLSKDNPWGAEVISRRGASRVCVWPASGMPIEDERNDAVCGGASDGEGGAAGATSGQGT
jgi:hypothetical protein